MTVAVISPKLELYRGYGFLHTEDFGFTLDTEFKTVQENWEFYVRASKYFDSQKVNSARILFPLYELSNDYYS